MCTALLQMTEIGERAIEGVMYQTDRSTVVAVDADDDE
jgi:hypothetical protein